MVHMCNQGCFSGIFLSTETDSSSYMSNYIGWKIKKDNYKILVLSEFLRRRVFSSDVRFVLGKADCHDLKVY